MNKQMIDDITKFIFISNEPKESDIIFALGGSHCEIPEKAAELYKNQFAPRIMPAGRFSVKLGKFAGVKSKIDIYNKNYLTECDFYSDVFLKEGVPEEAIYREDKSEYTIENAFFSRKVADENGLCVKKAIICCKAFHARRCLMLYQLAFPETDFIIIPVDSQGINCDNWYSHEYGIDRVLGELARCGNQFVGEIKKYLLTYPN